MLKIFLRNARYWKLLSFRKFIYFPRILSTTEKGALFILLALIFLSGGNLGLRIYWKLTEVMPQVGGSYREGILHEPRYLNPVFATQDADRDLVRLVFSSLFTYSGDGALKPELAERYEVGPDAKIYTIFLRRGIKWHDGKLVSADDVVFTIQLAQNPQYHSPHRTNWQGVSVEKIDDYTVRLVLRTTYAQFVENLTFGIIPKHLWQGISPEQALLHELNLKPVGSGPYKFSRLKQNKDGSIISYELVRNSNYFLEGPYLKNLTFIFLKTEEEAIQALRRGRIEGFGPISPLNLKNLREFTRLESINMPRIFGVFFNKKQSPLLENKLIREAIAEAINKKALASSINSGGVVATDSPLPPGSAGYTNDITIYGYHPEKSREILESLGWKDVDGNGIRERKKREKLKEVQEELRFTLVTSDWPDLVKSAEIIKEQLKEVGIAILIEVKPFNELEMNVLRPRNFEMLLFGEVYGYESDPFSFWHSSQIKDPGLNISLFVNKEIDKLLEEARKTVDAGTRNKKYNEFQKQISKELPAIFLYSQLYLYLLPSDIQGVNLKKISLPSDRFNEIHKWYRETKRVFK